MKKERENYEINNDGYYFPLYYYLGTATGVILGMIVQRFQQAGVGSVGQSIVLQFLSLLLLTAAQKMTFRATNNARFGALMLMLYYQVDMFQTYLFLQVPFFSSHFWQMLLVAGGRIYVKKFRPRRVSHVCSVYSRRQPLHQL